jgi:hypothetical protein
MSDTWAIQLPGGLFKGPTVIIRNGEDISDKVAAVTIHKERHQPTTVEITFIRADVTVTVTGTTKT